MQINVAVLHSILRPVGSLSVVESPQPTVPRDTGRAEERSFESGVPVFFRYDNGQEMHGWIDLLAETPNGWVIVDHKTYRREDPSSTASRYGAQLEHYRLAVERATGVPVVDTLINFVLLGTVYDVMP